MKKKIAVLALLGVSIAVQFAAHSRLNRFEWGSLAWIRHMSLRSRKS